jgi:hypothetical protein
MGEAPYLKNIPKTMKSSAHLSSPFSSILLYVFLFSLSSTQITAQVDSTSMRELALRKEVFFMKHHVALENYSFSDPAINLKLSETMRYHRKSKSNLIIGAVLSTLGLVAIISGVASKEEPVDPGTYTWDFGPSISDEAFGGILLAGSLPFFMLAESNNVKMKKSLSEAKRLLIE